MKRTWSQANADEDHEYGQLGIIESVKLQNFMCHENLSFDFDPHMNFIVGRNGSGKSAVLTGIILALGGKSGATGRFSNIKGFVKTGKNSASVSVTLKNCGPDAYKPNDYGEKITIERHFTADGVSTYKLKSESGRIISSSKEDLTNILSVMDIQIENPITVLTQETSRNFLVSKNSKGDKLFKLFYEGTGLSKVYDGYSRSLLASKEAKTVLQSKKSVLFDMEKDLKALKALLDKSAQKIELEKELLWAMVIEKETERNAKEAAFKEIKTKFSGLSVKLEQYEAEKAEICKKEEDAAENTKGSEQKMTVLRKEITDLDNAKSILKSEIRELTGRHARHERDVKKFENEISSIEKITLEVHMMNENDINKDKLNHEMKVKNLQNEITNKIASIGMMEALIIRLREDAEGRQKQIDTCHAEIQDMKYEKNRIGSEKQQIINGLKNKLTLFGAEMENVRRDINAAAAAGIFKIKPLGPIGLYIDVKKLEWSFAIQECLKLPLLRSFVCDNYEDGEQLSKIFPRHYHRQRPSIIISKFSSEIYDVSAHKCVHMYPTLFDMLHFKDPVIANCLIDQKQIENILLIEDPVEARNLMLRSPPKQCTFVYSLNGDQFCHSPVRKYSCRNKNQFCVLKSIQEDDLNKKDEELKKMDANINSKVQFQERLTNELKLRLEESEKHRQNIMEMKIRVKQLRMNLDDEESSYSEPKDINTLHTNLDELKKQKDLSEASLNSCKGILISKTETLKDVEKNLEECTKVLGAESNTLNCLASEVQNCQSRKEALDVNARKIKSLLEKIKQDLKDKDLAVKDSNATVETFTERASGACLRIITERSVDTIRSLLHAMERFLKQQKSDDRDSLFREYEEKVENFNKGKKELSRQEKINERLLKMIADRFKEFQKICKNTSVALTCAFTTLLKENSFSGYPDINFDSQTLEIFAKPEKMKSKLGKKPSLTQLSGGERSFVTIAFLLSLWDRMHSPFRILDEYDVFMDSNNRHLSVHLLINTAKSCKKIQYIFLSPLELPHIEDSDHVKVHQMPAPRK